MPESDSTATSVVPPPMSTTIEPVGSWIGRPAPIAAAIGSSISADAAGAGVEAAVVDRAALDRGRAGRHADDHLGIREGLAVVHLADEVLDHLLGDFEVGDDPVAHGADGFHVAGRAAQHLLGLDADGVDRSCARRRCAARPPRARSARSPCPSCRSRVLAVPRSMAMSLEMTPKRDENIQDLDRKRAGEARTVSSLQSLRARLRLRPLRRGPCDSALRPWRTRPGVPCMRAAISSAHKGAPRRRRTLQPSAASTTPTAAATPAGHWRACSRSANTRRPGDGRDRRLHHPHRAHRCGRRERERGEPARRGDRAAKAGAQRLAPARDHRLQRFGVAYRQDQGQS